MKNGKQLCVGDKKTYWYLYHYEECPDCGGFYNWKERVYDRPKPKALSDRIINSYLNCNCIGKY